MRDVLLKRPMGNSRNLLPYPVFIARLAIRHQVPEFPRDEIYNQPEQQEEQQPPPPSAASEIPSSSIQRPPEPSLREIMRYLERHERLLRRQGGQLQNTQNMIR
ncbi:hypothetical protein PIB30_094411 [Stylosanthes scabra]|uniref:Uncharacterized protein n=1 Tax=Stylosanthes scabra TaxID=79078 RepID=A0ABU6XUR0_9FABA|nr:hypothetical protein [Stylosanthes scabra]